MIRLIASMLLLVGVATAGLEADPILAQEAKWRTVVQWKGTGDKRTETFTIKSFEWRVVWERTVVGHLFTIAVHRAGESSSVAHGTYLNNQFTNTIAVKGAGEFYLVIAAGLAPAVWTVSVQEPETGQGRPGGY